MSAVIQMPSAIDASIRACCTEAVRQAVASGGCTLVARESANGLVLLLVDDKPKKAKTGYLLFCGDVRADVKAKLLADKEDGEKLKGSDVISGCAAKWKELSKEEQATWNELAKAAVERVE